VDPDRIVGTDVAGYGIESVLGRGAMGVVYVARQRSPARKVALKLITPAFADDEVFRRRFLREGTAAAAIEHPHILPVYAVGESDGNLFMAMRLVDGMDLREILRGSAELPLDRVERIVGQVGGALDAAHARGLIHRDVKPGNVLVAEQSDPEDPDFCYLMDFGVSTWTASSAATITATGQIVGTANYMAPEQIEGGRVDGSADLYSLGCVLYECLTGEAPFSGRSPAAILYGHVHEEAPAPTSTRPGLPPGVDAVTDRALRKVPEQRYASCRELTRDLRAALAGSSTVTLARSAEPLADPTETLPRIPIAKAPDRAPTSRSRGRATWVVAAVVTTVLVVAVVGLAFLYRPGRGLVQGPSPSGEPARLIREHVQVIASETAPSSTDAAGNTVTYVPANVIDGNVQTAWRTPGDGQDASVTLIFDNPINVVRIGLIPGYAKTDAQTGVDRFLQNRIIKAVSYQIPGLPNTTKTFRPRPVPQFVRLDALTTQITVKILDTTAPGGLDYTAISEIYVFGYEQ
jgi:serine/threonine protein kinase